VNFDVEQFLQRFGSCKLLWVSWKSSTFHSFIYTCERDVVDCQHIKRVVVEAWSND